ncbi:hypothetical protein DXG03_000661 [Asterophora parasitica]|uniref:Uncharacterized protein n=1 Tax=Asterophora parasitica TaxID=117018 RepID=A0A9P7G5N9_9AGAR|nr:hypothetical protein DXG03_000661 [Asterophora parasitica]
MGGEGPCVKFDPKGAAAWSKLTGIRVLSDPEREEAAYGRARSFFLQSATEWTATRASDSSWTISDIDNGIPTVNTNMNWFQVMFQFTTGRGGRFALPESFSAFLDPAKIEMWRSIVESPALFNAKRINRENSTLFIDSPRPLSDIFYLLQILAPGIFVISRIDEIDELGEEETVRVLPPPSWVEEHHTLLEEVLGGTEKFEVILHGAESYGTAFCSEWISRFRDYDDDDSGHDTWEDCFGVTHQIDYTACSLECGYCGRCDY